MKYIELPSLSGLASSLSHQGPECNVSVRLEAYSCKNIKRDKRLFRDLEKVYWDNMGVLEGIKYDPLEESSKSSPTEGASSPHSFLAQAHSSLSTPFGPLGSPQSRKTLHLLIATLNVAFPDYTFDSVKPSSFTHLESGAHILNALSTTLLASRASTGSPTTMATALEQHRAVRRAPTNSSKRARSPRRVSSLAHILKSTRFSTTSLDRSTNAKSLNTFQSQKRIPTREKERLMMRRNSKKNLKNIRSERIMSSTHNYALLHLHPTLLETLPCPVLRIQYLPSTNPTARVGLPRHRPGLDLRPKSRYPLIVIRLLWSSHWFFLNRKQKRILYVSVWARKRSLGSMLRSPIDEEYFVYGNEPTHRLYASAGRSRPWRKFSESDESDGSPVSTKFPTTNAGSLTEKERFLGWEGAAGAGARALGLSH
ncbi:hypothetical protein BT96DRAFT_917427 [Gymnopus androsaceus JB14]|uniref:Maf1-domain-containing protein n=1 Tax=Gymnopus androsaceus JB14 TaxID=1447944 RepID=A0A6A4I3D3_9AGAR|nr:hypothetical protein BT96DRAFT_917427 [Gymnopus androsaceus JB14]